ncbi:MAG: nicotinamide mononucleotide transporter [Terriglobales bacterium]
MERVLRLDYVSCVLTILSTVLVGRKQWQGWMVAGANSVLISIIGIRTEQLGFVPANVFCVAVSAYNLWNWRAARELPRTENPANRSKANLSLPLR